MMIGYARVSSAEQNLDLQLDALKESGCEKIFSDTVSGARKQRQGLTDALSHLREGDIFVVWKLDRLGRTLKGLLELTTKLEDDGIHFKSITDGIDTTTPAGRFFFH